MLFNEPEVLAAIGAAIGTDADAVIRIEEHERKKKPGKKAIPEDFPRIPVVHDFPESEKICSHDGTALVVIGHEAAERYDYGAPQLRVLVHKRLKYACLSLLPPGSEARPGAAAAFAQEHGECLLAGAHHDREIRRSTADAPEPPIRASERQCGPGTMALWMNTIGGEKLPPLIALMHEAMLAEPVLHCDETTVQVLKGEKAVSSDHYMIVRAAGPPGRRIVLYNYALTRNVETLKQILTGPDGPYRGKLVCDGLER